VAGPAERLATRAGRVLAPGRRGRQRQRGRRLESLQRHQQHRPGRPVRRSQEPLGAATNLSAAGQNADQPQVAVDRNGNAIAVWRRVGGGGLIIQAARYDAATNTWGAVSNL
jgi:hypothetical protein